MNKLNTLTLKKAINLLKKKEISHEDLYKDTYTAIEEKNTDLNVYLTLQDHAEKLAPPQLHTALAGVPIAVKDNFLTHGLRTTAASTVLDDFMPPYEASIVSAMKKNGGVVIGKTNMDAWAHGSSTETSQYGPTKNPRNPKHLPGGSSGGSAAAVAADMCIAAIGSETAGSVRQPAAWCGTVGLKPTYGRSSRYGCIAMGSSLDCPGPLTKTVEDAAILLNSYAGHDKYDATTSPRSVPDFTSHLHTGVKGLKIGITYLDHPQMKGMLTEKALLDAGKIFEKLGAHVELVPISDTPQPNTILKPDYAIGVYTVCQRAEVSSNLSRFDGIRFGNDRSFFGDEAKRRIMLGTYTLSKGYADKYYVKSQQVRSLFIQNFAQLFTKYDVLISPTSPGFALELGASANDPMFGELQDMLLEPSSISGLPGINVPCHHDEQTNLYLGMSIIADQWQEEKVIQVAQAYEEHTQWNSWK